ncbi:Ku protein [Streptomyces sp. ICBB 8177]|uniref:non-homologous end joining protein Ku n=1 Tax=Streptomyces sp. ICBB 8177 TaxID=563922 RepID=UPI000D67CA05|nr:Ku protein [Streptomyces sp. ICBB 8177]PWI42742.1 Ku protein [Streptomyces sp. ICBB 8177]
MRSIWKGAISFGLVSIPVTLYKATQEHRLPLHQVHAEDGGRIRQKRVCEKCGKEVAYADVAKGFEDDEGREAVLTDEDLADLPLPSKKVIDVLAFVDAGEIDPLMFSSSYYLGPASPAADKPYALLRDALADGGKAAVTKITISTRESLALLRVHDETLALHTMFWPDEVRSDAEVGPSGKVTIRSQERKMAASLMETLSEGFDLEELHDDYQEALRSLVAARLEGRPAPSPQTREAPDNVIDLTSALQASLEASGARKPEEKPAKKTASKRAASKKSASSRGGDGGRGTAAKKTTGKKAAAKKSSASGSGSAKKKTAKTAAKKTASSKAS